MTPQLVAIAIQQTPAVIALLSKAFKKANPSALQPTSEQVIAAFRQAFVSSLAVDEAWLAAHPEPVQIPAAPAQGKATSDGSGS